MSGGGDVCFVVGVPLLLPAKGFYALVMYFCIIVAGSKRGGRRVKRRQTELKTGGKFMAEVYPPFNHYLCINRQKGCK